MVCSYCRRKDHTRTTCNVQPLGNYNRRQCNGNDSTTAVWRCAHCACDVRPPGNNGVCQCVSRPVLEMTFTSCSRNAQVPTKNSSTRQSGEGDGNHLLCLDLTLGGPYLDYGVPLSGNKGVESRNEVADAPGGMRLQHPPSSVQSTSAGNQIIEAPSSVQSASANNQIEAHPGSGPIYRDGRWSTEEHGRFMTGLRAEGKGRWKNISEQYVKTRTVTQVRSHAQKYFLKLKNHKPKRER